MSEDELKLCPFCGGEPFVGNRERGKGGQHTNGPALFEIGCLRCNYFLKSDATSQLKAFSELKLRWNQRVDPLAKELGK